MHLNGQILFSNLKDFNYYIQRYKSVDVLAYIKIALMFLFLRVGSKKNQK